MSTVTVFLCCHSLERIDEPLEDHGVRIHVMDSQRIPGRINEENAESRHEKWDWWSAWFRRDLNCPEQHLLDGMRAYPKPAEEPDVEYALVQTWRPIRTTKAVRANRAKVWQRVQSLVALDLPMVEWFEYFFGSLPHHNPCHAALRTFFRLHPTADTDHVWSTLHRHHGISLNRMIRSLNMYRTFILHRHEHRQTMGWNRHGMVHNKEYTFVPNFDETASGVRAARYGLFLVHHSDLPTTASNQTALAGLSVAVEETWIAFESDPPTPFHRRALDYFSQCMAARPDRGLRLTDFVLWTRDEGIATLQLIDTGCRTFDPTVYPDPVGLEYVLQSASLLRKERRALK